MATSSKERRKIRRSVEKIQRDFQDILILVNDDDDDDDDEASSRHVVVCNHGLVTGATREELCRVLGASSGSGSGSLTEILLLPGKSYSFVSFKDEEKAKNVKMRENFVQQNTKKLYLAFVKELPDTKRMNNSWCTSGSVPKGLEIIQDFVSEAEENLLLKSIVFEGETAESLKHRRVQHYGFDFIYGSNRIDHEKSNGREFPSEWNSVILDRLSSNGGQLPDQCTVNEYLPGQGIPGHVDTHSCCTETIRSLSLGSDVVMEFTNKENSNITVPVLLPRRSMLVMTGEARYAWAHGIVPRMTDVIRDEESGGLTLMKRGQRTSLTFRKSLNGVPCKCDYQRFCDSQSSQGIKEENAHEIESKLVHEVYEEIADHFSHTRHTPWPKVAQFLNESLEENSLVVDVGCGNGKYLDVNRINNFNVGCDRSANLLSICGERGFNAVRSDCLNLPFKDGFADGVICIAVIHHLATKDRRKRALTEMTRILKSGGKCLIYAWAKDQKESNYLQKNCHNKNTDSESKTGLYQLPVHKNRTNFTHSDMLVPWKKENDQFHRFYHVFDEGELEKLINDIQPKVEIISSFFDQGNWCVIFQRL